ncbi:MAG: hydrogenase iron-sulfur subunit [Chloroflexi bacterium]|nr:hydrogenase iron-sulfur subunit [Chloroflexota bacterium]
MPGNWLMMILNKGSRIPGLHFKEGKEKLMTQPEPKLVCFSCKFGWGYLAKEEDLSRQIINWIPIICSGKIDAIHLLNAFSHGADGVLVLGCPEGDCHYQDGNLEAMKRISLLQQVLESMGIEKERLQIQLSIDPEGKTIPLLVKNMSNRIRELGPLKKPKHNEMASIKE